MIIFPSLVAVLLAVTTTAFQTANAGAATATGELGQHVKQALLRKTAQTTSKAAACPLTYRNDLEVIIGDHSWDHLGKSAQQTTAGDDLIGFSTSEEGLGAGPSAIRFYSLNESSPTGLTLVTSQTDFGGHVSTVNTRSGKNFALSGNGQVLVTNNMKKELVVVTRKQQLAGGSGSRNSSHDVMYEPWLEFKHTSPGRLLNPNFYLNENGTLLVVAYSFPTTDRRFEIYQLGQQGAQLVQTITGEDFGWYVSSQITGFALSKDGDRLCAATLEGGFVTRSVACMVEQTSTSTNDRGLYQLDPASVVNVQMGWNPPFDPTLRVDLDASGRVLVVGVFDQSRFRSPQGGNRNKVMVFEDNVQVAELKTASLQIAEHTRISADASRIVVSDGARGALIFVKHDPTASWRDQPVNSIGECHVPWINHPEHQHVEGPLKFGKLIINGDASVITVTHGTFDDHRGVVSVFVEET